MKKHLLLFLPLLCWFGLNILPAQNGCLPDGITFTSQAQIDSFPLNYPGCSVIEGDVTISGADIANLNGLTEIDSIKGWLEIIGNPVLESLSGLASLDFIGYSNLYPSHNYFPRSLIIKDNPELNSLEGLENITSFDGVFIIKKIMPRSLILVDLKIWKELAEMFLQSMKIVLR